VVFLPPALTGYVPVPNLGDISGIQVRPTVQFVPMLVARSNFVSSPQNAIGGIHPDNAILGRSSSNYGFACPNEYGDSSFSGPWFLEPQSLSVCRFTRTGVEFTGWLETSSNYFNYTTGTPLIRTNPRNVTAIKINASDVDSEVSGSGSLKYVVFARVRCTRQSTGGITIPEGFTLKYLGECTLSDGVQGRACTKSIGTSGCPSGQWDLDSIIVGQSKLSGSDPAIHWIQVIQSN
ncbi:MAG: hypothetical protein Q8R15_03070, partial [Candidatus Micrarchaeota archaeon]|nr:hypothetical protein [Candidatus Micrarchaeota archaeon]